MDDRFLVPATRALLEGWHGPIVAQGCDAVLLGPGGLDANHWRIVHAGTSIVRAVPISDLALDARRAEVRDRIARVLGGRPTATAPTIAVEAAHTGGLWLLLLAGTVELCRHPWPDDLDPLGETRLPDGSRAVDALALAAVAREVLRG